MLPQMCVLFEKLQRRRRSMQKIADQWNEEAGTTQPRELSACSMQNGRKNLVIYPKNKQLEIEAKVSHISQVIRRVAGSCLLRLPAGEESLENRRPDECDEEGKGEGLVIEVWKGVLALRTAYVRLREAQCLWDPEKITAANLAMAVELSRLEKSTEEFKGTAGDRRITSTTMDHGCAHMAAVEELRKHLKAKEMEVEGLKVRLKRAEQQTGRKWRLQSLHRKVSCTSQAATLFASTPTPELFEFTMDHVKGALKSFTAVLLSLMSSARWDVTAAVRFIEGPAAYACAAMGLSSPNDQEYAKRGLESFVSRKFFQGFENETFSSISDDNNNGSAGFSSFTHRDKFRADCITQYRDMKAMDPAELVEILPRCRFGKFCCSKFLAVVHPKMEESLFGGLEQRMMVMAGTHPKTEFYELFLGLAKKVWQLHLLAFALDPAAAHFQAKRGAEFHPAYMESVVDRSLIVEAGPRAQRSRNQVVGFSLTPGFKLGDGSVIKAKVYLTSRTTTNL